MEQTKLAKPPAQITAKPAADNPSKKRAIWDCESSLYDSFELKSFERQLSAAISAAPRSLSMPHLSSNDMASHTYNPQPQTKGEHKKPISKISRSFNRIIKAVFKPKNINNSGCNRTKNNNKEGFYAVYARPAGSLSTIPESPESDELRPADLRSFVRRTASDRFDVARTVGISC